jgi:hypothetical protein
MRGSRRFPREFPNGLAASLDRMPHPDELVPV